MNVEKIIEELTSGDDAAFEASWAEVIGSLSLESANETTMKLLKLVFHTGFVSGSKYTVEVVRDKLMPIIVANKHLL